jgi:hypothetical protein
MGAEVFAEEGNTVKRRSSGNRVSRLCPSAAKRRIQLDYRAKTVER